MDKAFTCITISLTFFVNVVVRGSFTSQPNHQLLFNKPEEFIEDFFSLYFQVWPQVDFIDSRLLSIANYKLLIFCSNLKDEEQK